MEIISIRYGDSHFPEKYIFANGNEDKLCPIVFKVLVIKDNNRTILVDAGCETMPGFDMHNFVGSVKALEKNRIFTDSITDVVITHAHHDHIECVKYFDKAVIHIQKDEYEGGRKYIPQIFNVNIFESDFCITENVVVKKIGGHSKGSCIVELYQENKTYVISGDECYSRKNLTDMIPAGKPYCPQKNKEFIEKYSSAQYNVLLCHDE